nr:hypothetical protein [Xanthomonadales bacterium]
MALTRFDHGNWLRYAGLFTYACVGVPLLRETAALAEEVDVLVWLLHGTVPDGIGVDEPRDLAGWWLAYVAFGLSYWALT